MATDEFISTLRSIMSGKPNAAIKQMASQGMPVQAQTVAPQQSTGLNVENDPMY